MSNSLQLHGLQYARLPCPLLYVILNLDRRGKYNKFCWEATSTITFMESQYVSHRYKVTKSIQSSITTHSNLLNILYPLHTRTPIRTETLPPASPTLLKEHSEVPTTAIWHTGLEPETSSTMTLGSCRAQYHTSFRNVKIEVRSYTWWTRSKIHED